MVGDARAHRAAADDHDLRGFHSAIVRSVRVAACPRSSSPAPPDSSAGGSCRCSSSAATTCGRSCAPAPMPRAVEALGARVVHRRRPRPGGRAPRRRGLRARHPPGRAGRVPKARRPAAAAAERRLGAERRSARSTDGARLVHVSSRGGDRACAGARPARDRGAGVPGGREVAAVPDDEARGRAGRAGRRRRGEGHRDLEPGVRARPGRREPLVHVHRVALPPGVAADARRRAGSRSCTWTTSPPGSSTTADRGRTGERYALANRDGNLSYEEFFRRVGEVTGVRRRMVGLPPRVAIAGATVFPWPVGRGEARSSVELVVLRPGEGRARARLHEPPARRDDRRDRGAITA